MKKIGKNKKCVEVVKKVIDSIYKNDKRVFEQLVLADGSSKILFSRINNMDIRKIHNVLIKKIMSDIEKIRFIDMHVFCSNNTVTIVSGEYEIIADKDTSYGGYEVLATFVNEKIVYLQINLLPYEMKKVHKIIAVNKDYYYVSEDEIYYVESQHNHVIWHCAHREIIATDSLQHLETVLSNDFIRIHRGYIVNKKHVSCVRRCEVELKSGDILQVPKKKYMQVKELFAI